MHCWMRSSSSSMPFRRRAAAGAGELLVDLDFVGGFALARDEVDDAG
jgi:hypothetical protein